MRSYLETIEGAKRPDWLTAWYERGAWYPSG